MAAGFISEMSALPIHGGGVTLERVLGPDLGEFAWFAETIRYPNENPPTYKEARSHSYPWWPIESLLASVMGCSRAYRIAAHPLTRRLFASRVASQLRHGEPGLRGNRLLVCPQSDITVQVVQKLRQSHGVEYVTWIMDDHLLRWRDGGWSYPDSFEKIMQQHLTQAHAVYVISPALQLFYRERFGVDSEVLCGPAAVLPEVRRDHSGGDHPGTRLAYFGSLGRWQNDAILLLAPLLQQGKISLDIFSHTPEAVPPGLMEAGAVLHQSIPAGDVLRRSADFDAVVLPVSFREELRNMSFFNVATKFAECLGSPVPTLLIGPPDAAMVRMARAASACAVVDEPSPAVLLETVLRLRDPNERARILGAERRLLAAEFSPEIMARRWAPARAFLFS